MAKNKKKPTKETVKMDESDEVLTEVDTKKSKKAEKVSKDAKEDKKKAAKQRLGQTAVEYILVTVSLLFVFTTMYKALQYAVSKQR